MVFVVFALIALCVAIVVVMFAFDFVLSAFRNVFVPFFDSTFSRIFMTFRRGSKRIFRIIFHKKMQKVLGDSDFDSDSDFDIDDSSEDISSDACAVLAMLPGATIVVDKNNDVLRASSQSYTLGVVLDDSIVQPRVLQAVNNVRFSGGYESFDLVTFTPKQYVTISEDNDFYVDNVDKTSYLQSSAAFDSSSTQSSDSAPNPSTISRPNWLNITVGSVGEGKVVVIINDSSAEHLFEQTRNDFISNVSNQLISSTRMISSLTNVLQCKDVNASRIKDIAASAQKSSKHLEHMLEDLLLLMRAQSPIDASKASVVNVLKVLEDVKNLVSALSSSQNVRVIIKADSSLNILADSNQISSAIRKLVENAIIYSHKNSVVALCALKSEDNRFAVIRVVDSGIGIPLKDQPRIFERFYRSSNQNDFSKDGVGLGLAIAKHVALTHHGSITLWSRPGQGTTVNFAIPLAK
ncbi:ATPase/histidine kinase/DNA gyrase B/HSP90 domain protein [Gardnerella pickettii JCP7659]|uniref:Sensor-like histidine kinase SenX3 n=2 Tax=Bifidobacteriaceae TaxID=31953 RepID=T2PK44_9BIFI|nr:ATPase/histidine kinase/DNA gyrase B/HSP90 domain protein [Gardnerella pickettii JCP8017A]EPI54999.1 ATPase/histidine kinase/DNA gyrase B/HSP90 domain protein [Gardnerella pickettii JCP7659]EPI61696.1 ATPase/histidine kinase/DNA gyrase B/HSP90 domain protein [Gardnerella pickettii JCP8017B]